MRLFLAITVLVVVLASYLAPVRASVTSNDLPGDFMGMVIRDPHYEWNTNPDYPNAVNQAFMDSMGQHLAAAGVRWVRFEFRAEDGIPYDPNNPLQGLRLEQYDYFVNTVAPRHNLKILGLLATNLVRNPGYIHPEEIERIGSEYDVPNCESYKYGCGTNPYMRIWLDRAFAIADRYQNKIAGYEVMNEENRYIDEYHSGNGISPGQMAKLMTKFYRVFKVTGPKDPAGSGHLGYPGWRSNVRLILGGIHPGRCNDCITESGTSMTDREYLDAIYKSQPFQDFRRDYPAVGYPVDGIAYHPYPLEIHSQLVPEPTGAEELYRVPERMEAMHQVMLANGDVRSKIWVTEIGDRGTPFDPDNQHRQAEFLRTIYRMLWQQRDFVSTVFWFKYEDFDVANGGGNWGVVRLHSRTPTADCPTCEYAPEGSVQVFKESYRAYTEIATQGIGQETYSIYLPIVWQGAAP
ncbi:MAG: hypothetical protein M3380_19715 [Chloroflexota bacterium]|nr:hypothetical protein [Chloroflexota bacterium]